MNSDTNKYRLKFLGGLRVRQETEAYLPPKAIEVMAESLKGEVKRRVLTFDGKEISKEHRKIFGECAKLRNKLSELETRLTELERAVIQRRKKPKQPAA